MKTPREENFVEFVTGIDAEELNLTKLRYISLLEAENLRDFIQNVMDYAESPKELAQLLMAVAAIQTEAIDLAMLQVATMLSPIDFDKLELFGKVLSDDEISEITAKYNIYIKNFEVRNLKETIGVTLMNDEFNDWPTIIMIYFGLIMQIATFE